MPGIKTLALAVAFLSVVGSNGKGMFDGNKNGGRVQKANRLKEIIQQEKLKLEQKVHLSKGEKTELLFKHMTIQNEARANGPHAHRFSALKKIAPDATCPDLCKSTWAELEAIYDEYLKCAPNCPQNLVVKKVMKSEEVGEVCSKDLVCWGKLEENVFKVGRSVVTGTVQGKADEHMADHSESESAHSVENHESSTSTSEAEKHDSAEAHSHSSAVEESSAGSASSSVSAASAGEGSSGSSSGPASTSSASGRSMATGVWGGLHEEVREELPDFGKQGGPCIEDKDCADGRKCMEVPNPDGTDIDVATTVASVAVSDEGLTNEDINEEMGGHSKRGQGGRWWRKRTVNKNKKGGKQPKSEEEQVEEAVESASPEEATKAFKELDTNGDGAIQHHEAMNAFLFLETSSTKSHKRWFWSSNKDKKGGKTEAEKELQEFKEEESAKPASTKVKMCINPDQTEVFGALETASNSEMEAAAEEIAKEEAEHALHDMDCSKKKAKADKSRCRRKKRIAQANAKAGRERERRRAAAEKKKGQQEEKKKKQEEAKRKKAGKGSDVDSMYSEDSYY